MIVQPIQIFCFSKKNNFNCFLNISRDEDFLRSRGKVFQVIIAEYKNEVWEDANLNLGKFIPSVSEKRVGWL